MNRSKILDADIEALEIEPGKLNQLETEVDSIKQTGESLRLNEEHLNKAAQDYQQARPQVGSAQTIKRFSGLLVFITLLATLAIGGAWYLFNKMPDSGYTTQLTGLLEQYVPAWNPQYIPQLGLAFVISAAALLVFWLIALLMKRKIAALLTNGEALADQVQAVAESVQLYDQRYVETINAEYTAASADDEVISDTEAETDIDDDESSPDQAADAVEDVQDSAATAEENKTISINATDLSAIRKCKMDSDQASALIDDIRQHLQNRLSSQQQSQQALEASLSNEQDRLAKAEALMGVISNLKDKLDETLHRIQIRDIADELIVAAARYFSQRFNKDLRELASRTLPLFTEDRYEHLHIDTDLNVRAFSSIKRDYMDLDEISSGTQRQIMLAVRLALSQELVNTTSGGDQFIFLDEPFAFFDQTRTRNAMSILPKLSEEIRQIWVIAQEFPEDTQSDRDIVCSREYDSITPATD